MEYAYRSREAFIELAPGESKTWRLPPCTAGKLIIAAFSINVSTNPTGGGGGGGGLGGGGGHIARERPTGLGGRRWELGGLIGADDFVVDGGGGVGPASGLTVELLNGIGVAATNPNKIVFDVASAGDVWSLRITRGHDGTEKLRYRIDVQYPSVLPIETRRIPARFFTRGFEQNWNQNPYLDYVRLTHSKFAYRWRKDFAQLYHKNGEDQYEDLPGFLKTPEITATKLTLTVGGGEHPIKDPAGFTRPVLPYLAMRLDAVCTGSRELELDVPALPNPTVTLPENLWFEVRFYLDTGVNGAIVYYPTVTSPLLDAIDRDISYPSLSGEIKTVNAKAEAKKWLENYLYQLQHSNDGEHPKFFDRYVRPYLVGRYEVARMGWDAAREEILISYVGKQKPRRRIRDLHDVVLSDHLVVATDGSTGGSQPAAEEGGRTVLGERLRDVVIHGTATIDAPRLFDTPLEMPLEPEAKQTVPVTPGALSKIDHIVILMQENRSFDQVLGYLSREGMLPRHNLLTGNESEGREAVQTEVNGLLKEDPTGRDLIRYQNVDYRSTRTRTSAWPSFQIENPCHGAACVQRQISDNMKGFIADYAQREGNDPEKLKLIMEYMTDAELPTYGALTREFAICDAWHCSHLGGTLPNRFISLTGDFSRDVFGSPELENPDLVGFAPNEAATFFDHLTAYNVPWRLYEHGYGMLRLMRNYTFDETNIVPFNDPDNGFVATASAGKLPVGVTFIEPDYIEAPNGNDDHAPADMINGQRLIATIMSALLENREQWAKTLFIITYDEHGGFYDHQSPPADAVPRLSPNDRRLGLRVPAFVISPFIPGMKDGKVNVSHTVFDHTSIPATVLRRFCGPNAPFMGARTAAIADVGTLLTLDTPRPHEEFEQLAREMKSIAMRPAARVVGDVKPAPVRRDLTKDLEDDFHGLIALASSMTGLPKR